MPGEKIRNNVEYMNKYEALIYADLIPKNILNSSNFIKQIFNEDYAFIIALGIIKSPLFTISETKEFQDLLLDKVVFRKSEGGFDIPFFLILNSKARIAFNNYSNELLQEKFTNYLSENKKNNYIFTNNIITQGELLINKLNDEIITEMYSQKREYNKLNN